MREKILKAIHKNSKLSAEDLSKMLGASEEEVKAVIKEMGYLFQAQDLQDEERYKKLDALIRQQQSYRKEYARSTPLRQLKRLLRPAT